MEKIYFLKATTIGLSLKAYEMFQIFTNIDDVDKSIFFNSNVQLETATFVSNVMQTKGADCVSILAWIQRNIANGRSGLSREMEVT